jgi:hypothetical protein
VIGWEKDREREGEGEREREREGERQRCRGREREKQKIQKQPISNYKYSLFRQISFLMTQKNPKQLKLKNPFQQKVLR